MFHIFGNSGVVQSPNLRVWAERGLVHYEDARTGYYDSMSVRTCLERISALSDMLGNSVRQAGGAMPYYDQWLAWRNFVDDVFEVCKRAREQGMPTDKSAVRDKIRRLPKTVCMPSELATF